MLVKGTKCSFSETDLQVVQQDLAYDPLYRIRQERVLDDDDSPGARFRQEVPVITRCDNDQSSVIEQEGKAK